MLEQRLRLLQPASDPNCPDVPREPCRIVGFDRNRAQGGLAERGLEAGGRNLAQEAPQRLVFGHANQWQLRSLLRRCWGLTGHRD
jgi:hypothetical protein